MHISGEGGRSRRPARDARGAHRGAPARARGADRRRARPPRVEDTDGERIRATVEVGGAVGAHKGVNVPGCRSRSLGDREGPERPRVRALARGRLRRALLRPLGRGLPGLRELLNAADAKAHVIAKVEKAEALEELDAIVSASDAVMVARGDLGVEIGPARRAARPEADHPLRPRAREAGDHGHADAGVDDHEARADPRRGERRRQRDPGRHPALMLSGRDGRRPLPGRERRVHGPDRARGRAEPRLPARARAGGRPSLPDGRRGDVERRVRHRRGARRRRHPRAHVTAGARPRRSRGTGRAGRSSP